MIFKRIISYILIFTISVPIVTDVHHILHGHEHTKCNETRELQLKNDEKDNLAFSINIVKSIQSLNTIFDNMNHFIDIHTNKLGSRKIADYIGSKIKSDLIQ